MPDVSDTPQEQSADTTEARGATPGTTTAEPSASNAGDVKKMSAAELREIIRNGTLPEPKGKSDDSLNDGVVLDDSLEDEEPTDDLDLNDAPEETEEAAPAEETETTETETTEEEAEATESTEEETTEESDETNAGPKRIRLRLDKYDSRDAAVIRLSNEKGISLDAARLELFGEQGARDASPAKVEYTEEAPQPEPAAEIGELEKRIATLKADKRKAADALEMGKVIEIDDKLDEAREQLTQAKAAISQEQQQQAAAFRRVEEETFARVSSDYPDANKPGTKLNELVSAELQGLRERNSPILDDPEWFELVTIRAARKLPQTETAKPAAAKPKATPAATKKATPLPAPGTGGVTTPAAPTADQIRQRIAEAKRRGDGATLSAIIREQSGAKAA